MSKGNLYRQKAKKQARRSSAFAAASRGHYTCSRPNPRTGHNFQSRSAVCRVQIAQQVDFEEIVPKTRSQRFVEGGLLQFPAPSGGY